MQVIISTRHGEVSEAIHELAEERFGGLVKYEERIGRVEVTLLEEKNRCQVQAELTVARRAPIHAHAEAPDFRTAIDLAVTRLARQLKKARSRSRNRKGPDKEGLLAAEEPQS